MFVCAGNDGVLPVILYPLVEAQALIFREAVALYLILRLDYGLALVGARNMRTSWADKVFPLVTGRGKR
jgi:hypothetical protein